jgi:fatty acid desaturase
MPSPLASELEFRPLGRDSFYVDLKTHVEAAGLNEKDISHNLFVILLNVLLLSLAYAFIVILRNSWLQLINSVYLAFVFTQIGFVVHDSGHRQTFRSARKNRVVCMIHANLLLGFSYTRWVYMHNRHHNRPNQLDLDPDIDIAFLAFSESQASQKAGIARFIVKYQAYFFFPLLLLEAFSLKLGSLRFLARNKTKHWLLEWVLIAANYILYCTVSFKSMNVCHAVLFVVTNHAFFGIFLGLIFVTNHNGMPLLDRDAEMDFIQRQAITARNLKYSRVRDYFFGGLSCQIEHHLFPSIPQNKLRRAQSVVRPYCRARGIAYHETGLFQAYREVLQHLHAVGAPLRRQRTGPGDINGNTATDRSHL